jgi:Flp pilus assembly pilin Flp
MKGGDRALLQRCWTKLCVAASSEDGTTFIEYVVVAAVAVALILGAVQAFFGGVADVWTRLTQMVAGAA